MSIISAIISPHPPILLPNIGSKQDRERVKNTILALENLNQELKQKQPQKIIISSPHPDWGFNVPLFFLAKGIKAEIIPYLIGGENPEFYFKKGKQIYQKQIKNKKEKIVLIASGDLSHVLKPDGPYGFHPDGPKFDQALIKALKSKDLKKILNLDFFYPHAGECGLRSLCFLLGILEEANINWQAKILSYEGPFGVGYLVSQLI